MKKTIILTLLLLLPSIALAQVIYPNRGGTGNTTTPAVGQVLVGNASGTFSLVATSSLGITGSGGSSEWTDNGSYLTPGEGDYVQVPYIEATSTTATSTFPRLSVTSAFNFLGTVITNVSTWFSSLFDSNLATKTTSNLTEGSNLYYTDARARGAISETVTGLDYSSGTGVLSLTSGYLIPTTTRAINWDTAFGWGNHASQGYLTGNQTITLSGDVSGSGTTGITVTVADNSHNHTSTTISGIDISDDTNLAGNSEIVLTGDSLSIAASIARDSELHSPVTLSGALDYITLVGQDIVRGAIDLATDITGVLADDNGGTGQSTYATGDTLYASGANTLSKLTIGASSTLMTSNGSTPRWATASTLCVAITGSAALCDGDDAAGTGGGGITSLNGLTNATQTFAIATSSNVGISIVSSGSSHTFTPTVASGYSIPSTTDFTGWNLASSSRHSAVTLSGALDYITLVGQDIVRGAIDLATDITGVLADDNGGTGQSTYATGDMLYASGANTLTKRTIGSTGNVLSVVGGVPTWVATSTLGISGGSGTVYLATTSPWTNGELAYVTGAGTVGSVATGTLTETVSGLELSANRALVGGSAILSLTSGFTIPTTTDITNWNNAFSFYTTPSSRITAGTNLSWSGNTLNAATQISTSSTPGNLAFWTGTSALGNVATGSLTETVTGLQFDNTRALVGGSAILSLTSGFTIPSTTDITGWNLASSSRHSAVTLSGALDYITLVGQDIVRGAIDLATDVTGFLGISNGGTGTSTAPAQDQILVGKTGGTYDYRRITAGSNVTVSTSTPGQIIISSTATGSSSSFTVGATSTPIWRSTLQGWTFPDGYFMNTDIQAHRFHTIKPIWFEVTATGSVLRRDVSASQPFGYNASNTEVIKEYSSEQFVTVSGNNPEIHTLTGSSTAVTNSINTLIGFATSTGFTGIELDWEGFGTWTANETTNYISYVTRLSNEAHKYGLKTMIYLPPIWNSAANSESGTGDEWDSANSDGYYQLEYEDFENVPVDYLLIAVYDYHFDYGAGRPNAPLKWQDDIISYAKRRISDHDRLIIGIPAAGYGGATGGFSFTAYTYASSTNLAGFSGATRDAESGELTWTNGGNSYFVSDDESINIKRLRAEEQGISKVSVWHIGGNRYGSGRAEPTLQEPTQTTQTDLKAHGESGGFIARFFSSTGSVIASITDSLFSVTGTSTLATTTISRLSLTGGLEDSTASIGTSGMVLQSTGTSTRWVATSSLGISGGSGGGGGALSTTTDIIGAPGTVENLSYVDEDFLIGGSSSTSAEFQFDPDGGQLFIASTSNSNATATVESSNSAQAVRLGDDSGVGIEWIFSTAGRLITRFYGAITEWFIEVAKVAITGDLFVATTTYNGATTTDALVIDGYTNSGEWIQEFCTSPAKETTQIAADTLRVCNSFSALEDTNGVLDFASPSTATSSYFRLRAGTAGTATAAGDGMALGWALGQRSANMHQMLPAMEWTMRQDMAGNDLAASSTFVVAGIANKVSVAVDMATEPTEGVYVISTSTTPNYVFACNPASGATTYIGTGIASSTSATAGRNPFIHFRVEMEPTSTSTAHIFTLKARTVSNQNMTTIASCTMNNSGSNTALAPVIGVGKSTAGTSIEVHTHFLKYWYKNFVF